MNETEKLIQDYNNGRLSDLWLCSDILATMKPGEVEKYLPLLSPKILEQLLPIVAPKLPAEVVRFSNSPPPNPETVLAVRAWLEEWKNRP